MSVHFTKDGALFEWWDGLEKDRGSRAVLRRASSLTTVTLTPAYQKLVKRLAAADWPDWQKDRLAAVIGVLAHVKTNDSRLPAKAMSQRATGEDRPPVSELRFMRLLDSPDMDAVFSGVRRALPLMNHSVDVNALANDLMHWGDEVKKRWAYSYDWPDK